MKRFLLFTIAMLACFAPSMQGKMTVNMGRAVLQSGTTYTFPYLTVTADNPGTDRAYIINIMLTRATSGTDKIVYPGALPTGWTTPAPLNTTPYVTVREVSVGATAQEVQDVLRTVQFTHDVSKKGQGALVMLGEQQSEAGRQVFYWSDQEKWYEFIAAPSIVWVDAYNNAHNRPYMGMSGHLATITSAEEQAFIKTVAQGQIGWVAGTRMDITKVMNADGTLDKTKVTTNSAPPHFPDRFDYWYWADGPEWTGNPEESQFYNKAIVQAGDMHVGTDYPYSNFGTGEPNNSLSYNPVGGEFCAHLRADGFWNDFSNHINEVQSYLVEYEGTATGTIAEGEFGFVSSLEASIGGVVNNGTAGTPVPLLYGDVITYTITAANVAESSNEVTIVDELPAGLEYISSDNGGSYAGGAITWNIEIVPGQTANVSFTAKKLAGAKGLMVNVAKVTSGDGAQRLERETYETYHIGVMANVTFAAGAGGAISGGAAQEIDYGLNPAAGVTPTPNTGYAFAGWSYPAYTSLKGEQQTAGSGIMDYQTISVMGTMALMANFTAIPYTVTVGGAPLGDYNVGQDVPITAAEPPAGQMFVRWTATPEVEFADATDPSTTFKMPAEAVEITAVYADAYAVTVTGGSADRSLAAAGMTIALTADPPPAAGQVFDRWKSGDVGIDNMRSAEGATFVMPAKPVSVTATYKDTPMTLDELVAAGKATQSGDSYTLTDDYTIPAGDELTIGPDQTLIIPGGKTLTNEGMLTNEGTLTSTGSYEGTGTTDHLGTVTLDELAASGDATKSGDNTYTLTGDYEVLSGSELVVDDGETLIIPDGETLSVPDDATLSVPEHATLTNDGKLENNGKLENEGTINNKGGIENNGTYEGEGMLDHTGEVTLDELVLSGDASKSGDSYTLEDDYTVPAGSELVIADGESLTVPDGETLTIPDGATLTNNGTLTNEGDIVNEGEIGNNGVLTNDGGIENNGKLIVAEDATLDGQGGLTGSGTVIYKSVGLDGQYTILAWVDGANGRISPTGAVATYAGRDRKFTFIPDAGYAVDVVTVDGKAVPKEKLTGDSYTFKEVAAYHEITVTFRPATVANEEVEAELTAYARDGRLYVSGLTPGEAWSVYNLTGAVVYNGVADSGEAVITLPAAGIYIVRTPHATLKAAAAN